MAAKETVNNDQTLIDSMVNRWIWDYYGFRALEFFQEEKYEEFCSARDILQKVLDRPMESTNATNKKIQVLQFLSRINEGENLEMLFDRDQSVTPLESALMILESWQECNVQHDDLGFEKVCSAVKEMMVGVLIKNREFDKAQEILEKHFPKPMAGKNATFMSLIKQKNNKHRLLNQLDFPQFKEMMLGFCLKLCPFNVPFLYEVAKRAVDKRQQNDREADEEDECSQSCSPQIASWKRKVIAKARLKAAYQALSRNSELKTFAQLEEEVVRESRNDVFVCLTHKNCINQENVEEKAQYERQSGSPMEASLADQPQQANAVIQTQAGSFSNTPTVGQLVIQPDSQVASECTQTSQETQFEVTTEEVAESQNKSNKKDLQCPVAENEITNPVRLLKRKRDRASTSRAELSEESEEDLFVAVTNKDIYLAGVIKKPNCTPKRKCIKARESKLNSEKDPQESRSASKSPAKKPHRQQASQPLSKDPGNADDISIIDSSLDSSPSRRPLDAAPQTSSTPQKVSTQSKESSDSKWKRLFREAKETKETWSEDSFVSIKDSRELNESTKSNLSHRKRMWTESETERLKEGVKKFGEGNWNKIRAYCGFKDRTNVNLKDRWRTMKKLDLV